MLYDYILKNYKEGEPIFFADLPIENISKSAVSQQLRVLCYKKLLTKYDTGIYYIPKKSPLNAQVGLSADLVAKYRFISKGDDINGFYSGATFANQIGVSLQVPRIVEIVSNNTNSSPREVTIGKRKFLVRKPYTEITKENAHVLQLLDFLKSLESYRDCSIEETKERVARFINVKGISKADVDMYIRDYPIVIFKNYYELELENVFA